MATIAIITFVTIDHNEDHELYSISFHNHVCKYILINKCGFQFQFHPVSLRNKIFPLLNKTNPIIFIFLIDIVIFTW